MSICWLRYYCTRANWIIHIGQLMDGEKHEGLSPKENETDEDLNNSLILSFPINAKLLNCSNNWHGYSIKY